MIQREIETNGIATISITLSKEIAQRIKPPRVLYTGMPLGHPFSFPGQTFRQMNILRLLLSNLKDIVEPGIIIELDLNESDDPTVTCPTCGT